MPAHGHSQADVAPRPMDYVILRPMSHAGPWTVILRPMSNAGPWTMSLQADVTCRPTDIVSGRGHMPAHWPMDYVIIRPMSCRPIHHIIIIRPMPHASPRTLFTSDRGNMPVHACTFRGGWLLWRLLWRRPTPQHVTQSAVLCGFANV